MNEYTPVALSPEKQQLCRGTLKYLHSLATDVKAVGACGVDCSGYEALRQKLIEVNQAVHEHFCKSPELPV